MGSDWILRRLEISDFDQIFLKNLLSERCSKWFGCATFFVFTVHFTNDAFEFNITFWFLYYEPFSHHRASPIISSTQSGYRAAIEKEFFPQ